MILMRRLMAFVSGVLLVLTALVAHLGYNLNGVAAGFLGAGGFFLLVLAVSGSEIDFDDCEEEEEEEPEEANV